MTVVDQASQASCGILQMLARASVDHRAVGQTMSSVDLVGLIDQCLSIAAYEAHIKGQDLAFHEPTLPVNLVCDEIALRAMVLHLILNAVRHTANGTTISIDLVIDAGEIFISVSDDGQGLPVTLTGADLIDPTIDQAVRGASAVTTATGLQLVSAVARAHGGAFDLESEFGAGTTQTVCLPLSRAEEPGSRRLAINAIHS
jgi:signal transduction histidine kinase